ncbi:MAG: ATP-dependent helicase [Halobacteriales archaeon]
MEAGPFERVRVGPDDGPSDEALYGRLCGPVARWWRTRFDDGDGSAFTRPQRGALPGIAGGTHTLVAAPTGTGKTLAAFVGIIDDLLRRQRDGDLEPGIRCIYVAPMRALANDVARNLARPLEAIADDLGEREVALTYAIRHGDTDDAARRRMREHPPHILATTPETLAILLNAPRLREHLRTVEYVVVDELHAIANRKRGVHLAVSLERLEDLAETDPVRVGCSATVAPLEEAAAMLVGRTGPDGPPRACRLVDARGGRPLELALEVPTPGLRSTPYPRLQDQLFERLHALVQAHETTLVFTNSRAGAERILAELRERYDGYDERAACHHGSLGTRTRERVEAGLKAGEYDLVTTSTSLELGVDMPSVDLVVQLGSAKSVATLLQRVGRAGHHVGATRRGRVLATDPWELLECAAQVRLAADGDIEALAVPEAPLDVAVQHVYGMAVAGPVAETTVLGRLRRAWPYRSLADDDFEAILAYLAADEPELAARNVYPKIWRDHNDPPGGERHREAFAPGEAIIGSRGRLARMIYFTNVGTIPDEFACQVRTLEDDAWVGELDDAFLDVLEPGDVFVLGGDRYAFRYRKGGTIYVEATDATPTVPQWESERRPTTAHLARGTRELLGELAAAIEAGGPGRARRHLRAEETLAEGAVRAIVRELEARTASLGPAGLATADRIVVEEVLDRAADRRRYFVRTRAGGGVNEALARLVADRSRARTDANVPVAFGDDGFAIAVPTNCRLDVVGTLRELSTADLEAELRSCLRESELFERHFRMNATRSLLVLRRYGDHVRTPAEQQFKSDLLLGVAERLPACPPLEETYRELLVDRLEVDRVGTLLDRIEAGELAVERVALDAPSPAAEGLLRRRGNEGVVVVPSGETRQDSAPTVGTSGS